ncbi:MAG: SPFH domain-containing protein [Saprospiraceae bacterium]|nr:SPFH domain-containing protein [Saprospiraceae bacterium]
MKAEKLYKPSSGYLALLLILVLIAVSLFMIIAAKQIYLVAALLVALFCLAGFIIVNPNESSVLVLFGKYVGTVKENGFFWVNPFYTKKKISLSARNLDSTPIKVNDKLANPIMIGVVMVWKVENTFKASFDVDDYIHFVNIQTEAAVRKLAGMYPYDNFDDDEVDITLRSGGEEVNHMLEKEIIERLEIAGIHVIEARISYLAYAQEIASAMLRRQQATAIVAARIQIVEGAVSMVEMALQKLSEKKIVDLDDERKAAMVSNLMVVLCSDKDVAPIVNTGTLHQ